MKYISEFRNPKITKSLVEQIQREAAKLPGRINIMEVCGTHTMALSRYGIRKLLPENVKLLSGPGCPVCVTPNAYIDQAVEYSFLPDTVINTFGDMLRVPGSFSSMEKAHADGGKIEVVYSPMETLDSAMKNPGTRFIFLGVGFETTVPVVAATLKEACNKKVKNFFVFSGHKLIPPAMNALLEGQTRAKIDSFICPGHVSIITGSTPYEKIASDHGIPCVISGFEPADILESILIIIDKLNCGDRKYSGIQYSRIVKRHGNKKARALVDKIFQKTDSHWRGIGIIKQSGLAIKPAYMDFDAEKHIPVKVRTVTKTDTGCICGEILKGNRLPPDCMSFKKGACTPENPAGPCMVSSEGTCAAFYRYGS